MVLFYDSYQGFVALWAPYFGLSQGIVCVEVPCKDASWRECKVREGSFYCALVSVFGCCNDTWICSLYMFRRMIGEILCVFISRA